MFEVNSDMQSVRRGSFFTTPLVRVPNMKPTKKKSPFFMPFNGEQELPIQRSRVIAANVGDRNKIEPKMFNQRDCETEFQGDANKIEVKQSRTVVVNKTKLIGGHFAKLKKKHHEEYNKFRDEKSKSLELLHLQTSIEKMQAKISELTNKAESESKQSMETKVVNRDNHKKFAKEPIKWNQRKVFEALGITVAMIVFLLIMLYIIEGKNFSQSIIGGSLKIRSTKPPPKSIFKKLFAV